MKKKITLIVVAALLVISLIIGISYAYWRLTYTATKTNKIVSSCFSMELTNEKNNITLDDAYPISDEKGKSLTPYSFTITNTCDLFASYTINLEMLEGTTLNSKYIKTMINNEAIANLNTLETTDPSIDGATESRVLFKGSLGSGDSVDYAFRVWMDSETPFSEDSMNKVFQAKITVTGEVSTYSPVENGFTNLADALLVNEYQTTNVDVAKNKINLKQSVDLSKTAPVFEWQSVTDSVMEKFNVIKVDPSAVGTYGIHLYASQIYFAKSYTFDSSTGFYTLSNGSYYNPSSLDFSASNYYICMSSIVVTGDNSVTYWDDTECSTLYRIVSINSIKNNSVTLSDGDSVETLQYSFNVYKNTGVELESDKSDKGLYESLDDDGTTYYYRGNVTNNYVKFAGINWRVVRINGDGTVRIIYDGDDSVVGVTNFSTLKDNPTYVGYMYSNTLNTSYEDTISNDNDSVIKGKLDDWYKNNILNAGLASYIADSGFCNDRSVSDTSPGLGASYLDETIYGPRYRLQNNVPTFICSNAANDLFTLSSNSKGNQKLTYPIGLITADELVFAGLSFGKLNKMSYIHSSRVFWTMSPNFFGPSGRNAYGWYYSSTGSVVGGYVSGVYGIRPVINLKSTTEISGGIGTKNDPFIVK